METTQVFVSGGKTLVSQAYNSDELCVCSNGILKIFDVSKPEREPEVIDVVPANSLALKREQKEALIASSNGEVYTYDLKSLKDKATLFRSSLALTDAVYAHGGSSVLCGGLEARLQLVDSVSGEQKNTLAVADQIAAISYNSVGDLAAVALANGTLAVYSYSTPEPTELKLFQSLLPDVRATLEKESAGGSAGGLDDDDDDDLLFGDDDDDDRGGASNATQKTSAVATSRPDWHPAGDLLAVPTRAHDVVVYDRNDFSATKATIPLKKALVDLRWSPNGKLLAAVDVDRKVQVWELSSKQVVKTFDLPLAPYSLSWSGRSDKLVVGTVNGNIVKLALGETSSSGANQFVADEADEDAEEEEKAENADQAEDEGEGDDLGDEDLGLDTEPTSNEAIFGEDDFIVDDDGAGYVEKKRSAPDGNHRIQHREKQRRVGESTFSGGYKLRPYSPGSTPWNADRRYLTINPIGYAWAVKQEGYNTVTVTFFDRSAHREYHLRDFSACDLASINDEAVVLGSSGYHHSNSHGKPRVAKVLYKTHDQSRTWQREIYLKPGEFLTTISLSQNAVFVCTSSGYVRKYSLYGRLERMEKMPPVAACINSDRYLLTVVSTSPFSLAFNLQDLDGRYFQRNEPLPVDASGADGKHPIRGLFFSSDGDPCVVGQDNVLCVLARWRDPLQATWVPVLDATEGLGKIASGKVSAWPLGLFKDQFNFIVVRGSEYPSFPLTLPSEMPLQMPVAGERPAQKKKKEAKDAVDEDEDMDVSKDEDDENNDTREKEDAEEALMRCVVLAELLNDAITNDDVEDETAPDRLSGLSVQYDAALLRQVGQSCNDGDVLDAFYLVTKLRADRALAAASKMAERLELTGLVQKINRLREARMEIEEEDQLEAQEE